MHKILCLNKISLARSAPPASARAMNFRPRCRTRGHPLAFRRDARHGAAEVAARDRARRRRRQQHPGPEMRGGGHRRVQHAGRERQRGQRARARGAADDPRRIIPAIEWARTLKGNGKEVSKLVERARARLPAPELLGKKLGVIGLGAIGVLVANAAQTLGMQVYGSTRSSSRRCGVAPLEQHHKGRLARRDLRKLRLHHGARAAERRDPRLHRRRGALEDEARRAASELLARRARRYGGTAAGARERARGSLCDRLPGRRADRRGKRARDSAPRRLDAGERGQLRGDGRRPASGLHRQRQHHKFGEFPGDFGMPRGAETRICIAHRNIPNTISAFTTLCGEAGINIENMLSKSRGDWAYRSSTFRTMWTQSCSESSRRSTPSRARAI